MSAYAPLAAKVFGSTAVAMNVRINLALSLVLARLLHNTQAWTSWSASLYRPLNAIYMRVMRKIAGACRFGQRGVPSDDVVRQRLGVPSLQCLIIRRRLSLLVALLQSKTMPLVSLLAAVGGSLDHPRMPWALLITDDLSALAEFHRSRPSSLGLPCENAAAWESFITEYPYVLRNSYSNLSSRLELTMFLPPALRMTLHMAESAPSLVLNVLPQRSPFTSRPKER
jgi:hypothetical protein